MRKNLKKTAGILKKTGKGRLINARKVFTACKWSARETVDNIQKCCTWLWLSSDFSTKKTIKLLKSMDTVAAEIEKEYGLNKEHK